MNRSSNLHEKKTGKLLPCYPVRSCIAAALLLVMSFFPVSSSFASGGTDFEIPISELSKEKKPSPSKHTPGKPKKKKKNDAKTTTKNADAAIPAQPARQAEPPGSEPKHGAVPVTPVVPAASVAQPDRIRIDHDPYSYVVAGKSTVIHAVIFRNEADLQTVTCKINAAENKAPSLIKMTKVNGTRFTYTAILPGVAPNASSLRYTIVVEDSSGKGTISQEFVSPVTSSPLAPNWQF